MRYGLWLVLYYENSYPVRKVIPIFFVKNFILKLKVAFSLLDPRLVTIPLLVPDNPILQLEVFVLASPMTVIFPVFLMDKSFLLKKVTVSFQLKIIKD